ncbi:helix-turn-helix transcriptional regulator [Cryptosporangium aurantiacum]|uniref:helix-turn-helix transcriptional regulator n=1 Tax=Cryptosporangium aurantiacum TaxID=134849 RepID=UPI0015BB4A85|nr:LuxR C-terminal-related transcriptional regulator [Cryptosporangium aurantiacum]
MSARIEAGTQRGTTLLCAGAGWGKTVAARAWAVDTSRPVGWLTLSAADDDPATFWTRLSAVLHRAGGPVPGSATPRDGAEALRLIDGGPDGLVLVLDGVDEIRDSSVLDGISALLQYPPSRLAVVLLARSEPLLPLHRQRVTGELTELDDGDLRLLADEAAQLLAHHGVDLDPPDVQAVLDRTGGWPAGVSLAAGFLGSADPDRRIGGFTGAVPSVSAYLTREVLDGLAASVRSFLRRTSVPDEISAELADALTGRSDGARILAELERANAFVTRSGSRAGWYRYHPMLRDVLHQALSTEDPSGITALHRRAARWHDAQDDMAAAVDSAAAGKDWLFLAHLLTTRSVPLLLTGDSVALATILNRIPADAYLPDAEFGLCAALLRYCAGDHDAVPDYVRRARRLLAGRSERDRRPIDIVLRTLDLLAAGAGGDLTAQTEAATEVLDLLVDVPVPDLPAMVQYRTLALAGKGIGLFWTGQQDESERYLEAAVAAARASGVRSVELHAAGHLALLAYLRGAVTDARDLALACHDPAGATGVVPGCLTASVTLTLVELDRLDVRAAERALRVARAARTGATALSSALVDVAQATYARLGDDLPAARAALRRVRSETRLLTTASTLARWAALVESEVDLAEGLPERVAPRLASSAQDDPLTRREAICLARAEVALGDFHGAEEILARLGATSADLAAAVEYCVRDVLLAIARRRADRVLGDHLPELPAGTRDGNDRALRHRDWPAEGTVRLISEMLAAPPALAQPDEPQPVDRLSERERDVLRYLPTMLNAQEIADELHVSVNTVKAHLKAIYRKLGASRRREAVVRARRLGILRGAE